MSLAASASAQRACVKGCTRLCKRACGAVAHGGGSSMGDPHSPSKSPRFCTLLRTRAIPRWRGPFFLSSLAAASSRPSWLAPKQKRVMRWVNRSALCLCALVYGSALCLLCLCVGYKRTGVVPCILKRNSGGRMGRDRGTSESSIPRRQAAADSPSKERLRPACLLRLRTLWLEVAGLEPHGDGHSDDGR